MNICETFYDIYILRIINYEYESIIRIRVYIDHTYKTEIIWMYLLKKSVELILCFQYFLVDQDYKIYTSYNWDVVIQNIFISEYEGENTMYIEDTLHKYVSKSEQNLVKWRHLVSTKMFLPKGEGFLTIFVIFPFNLKVCRIIN